jgi:hypothetical protein
MLTEEQITDKIEVVGEHRIVQIRKANVIKRDGVEISREYNRHTVVPGEDASSESAEVQAIVAAMHTDAVVADYEASIREDSEI